MRPEVKDFFQKLQKKKPDQVFLMYRFYLKPEVSLGGSAEETMDDYYNYGDIKQLILNPTFLEFLKVLQYNGDFYDRLNYNLLRKIKYILYDTDEFINEYFDDLEDPYLQDFCLNKVPAGPIYSKKYNMLQLWAISEKYKKHKWMYDLKISKEKFKEIDKNLIRELMHENQFHQDCYYERYIKPLEDKKWILKMIKNDDYKDPGNCFLGIRNGHDYKSFLSLVCENEFLNIVENDLISQELPDTVIQNIINILDISICFKTLQTDAYMDFWRYYNVLGEKHILSFDHQRALGLITLLESRRNLQKRVRSGFVVIK